MVAFKEAGQSGLEVHEQMVAVSHLLCLRSAASDGIGVIAGSISAHDLDARVLSEPLDQRLRLAVWEHIHHEVSHLIDQDRSIASPRLQAKSSTPNPPCLAAHLGRCR